MIIVSQDKNTIVNFNTISEIYKSGKQILCAFPYIENYIDTLGTYTTEERAKEVLLEIKGNWEMRKDLAYYMPKE